MLWGRDQEQKAIGEMLDGARAGRSGVLAFVGEPGIGKSAVLADAAEQAGAFQVLRARGVQSETHVPFGGLFELVRPALGSLEQLPRPQAEAIGGALALRRAAARDRFAVGAATLSLLAAHAERAPVLVLLDDVQWLDGSSADALRFAIRRLIADPVAVLLTARSGEPSLLDGADLQTHTLEGLDAPAAAELLRAAFGGALGPDAAARLRRDTGGNPLALLELGEQLRERGEVSAEEPEAPTLGAGTSVARAYAQRSRTLSASTQDVLLLAAALDSTDMAALGKAAALLGHDLVDLMPAERAGLVTVYAGLIEFRHPLARSAIYTDALPERRRAAHQALAKVLPDVDVDRRAWHLALAAFGPDDAACSALEQAGQRARARSAYEVASRAYERGARLAPEDARRGRLLFEAAESAWLGGHTDRAIGLLDDAAVGHEPSLRLSIAHLRGHIATRRGPIGEAHAVLVAAAAEAAATDPDRAVVMLAEAGYAAFCAADADGMRRAADEIERLLSATSDKRTLFFARITQGMAEVVGGDGERGAALIHQAVEGLSPSDELSRDVRLLSWVAMGAPWLRDTTVGRELGDRALAVARQEAAIGVLPGVINHLSIHLAASDRWAEAQAAFHEVIDLARETDQRTELAWALTRLAWLEARQGRSDEAVAHAEEALELSRHHGLGLSEVWATAALGDLELGSGNADAALVRYEELAALLGRRGVRDVDLSPDPELVELYLRVGRPEQAAEAAERYRQRASAKGLPWALARAERAAGILADNEHFQEHFDRALDHHAATPDTFETARTHLAYGGRLRRARQRREAREQLRAAIQAFDALGADPWSEAARTELAATGETARRRDPSTLYDLTPQELQIALRLAEGRTTREAAAALFLSPKTVEYHLRNIYRKLGISTRPQLTEAMANRG